MSQRVFPIGEQVFENIINRQMVYVDKTALIYRMVTTNSKYFLSRPRRFGKSLLCSTLDAYFRGKKELFKELAIDKLEEKWTKYPVFHFDFSATKYLTADDLKYLLNTQLKDFEKIYGENPDDEKSSADRLNGLIQRAYEQTGEKVVIIIDEYDAPLHDAISNVDLNQQLRQIQRQFFSPLKRQDQNIRFIFITGITKFSQMSIFSELNNLQDISLDTQYEDICGISEKELTTMLSDDIAKMAQEEGIAYEECLSKLKYFYDGYHFSKNKVNIYNPYSLINALGKKRFGTFWFSTGTPTFLMELVTDHGLIITDLEGKTAKEGDFDTPADNLSNPLPILYQSGYLTIKDFDHQSRRFTLGFPNEEVHEGFANSLVNYYVKAGKNPKGNTILISAMDEFTQTHKTCSLLDSYRSFIKSTSYDLLRQNESLYQAIFYTWLVSNGLDVHAEKSLSDGRMDILLKTDRGIWIFEFKYNESVEEAIDQIYFKRYMDAFIGDQRPVHLVGVNIVTIEKKDVEWTETIV